MLMEAPAQEALANARPSNVLDRFNDLREEVIDALAAAHKLAQTVGPLAEQVEPHIAAAHRQVRESRLNLVIVGAEGVGKSTLINAITGSELSPQEQMYPGTVAPVFLDWSPDSENVFTVQIRGESEPVLCRDADEFRSYLLQKDNADNHKQVVWGRVAVDHPILAKGLRLVDMPGVEGLSPVIAVEAQRFIQSFAHAVVGVVRDRGYGALARILNNFSGEELRLQSLVLNLSLDAWIGHEDEAMSAVIAEQKHLAGQLFQSEDAPPLVAEEDIHVLHLPSLRAAREGGQPMVTSEVHAREAETFLNTMWRYVQANGVDSVILDSVGAADRAVSALISVMTTRQKVLASLIDDGAPAGHAFMATFERARTEAGEHWGKVFRQSVTDSIAEQTWGPLKTSVDRLRDRLLDSVHDIRGRLANMSGKLNEKDADQLRQHLERLTAELLRQVEDRQVELLDDVLQYFSGHANTALDIVYKRLPVLRDTLEDEMVITPDSLLQMQLGKMNPSMVENIFKAGSVGSASFLAGKLSAGGGIALLAPVLSLNPIGALLIGASVGGFLAGGLIEAVIFNPRRTVRDALDRLQTQIQKIDTSEGSPLREAWTEIVQTIATNVDEVLRSRMDGIARLIEDPGANQDVLAADKNAVDKAIGEASELARRLDGIGIMAGGAME